MSREWVRTFGDPAVLSDLRAAVVEMAAEVDDCDPETCAHDAALVHPLDVHDWIEEQIHAKRRAPLHMRPAGQPHRRPRDPRLEINLSAAG